MITIPQVTPPLLGSPVTVAVNCCEPPDIMENGPGEIAIAMPGTVMVADATTAESITEVAVRLTCKSPAGGAAGAV